MVGAEWEIVSKINGSNNNVGGSHKVYNVSLSPRIYEVLDVT